MITTLNLDESAKLEFGVAITGASGVPTSRFIIEGKDYSVMFSGTQVNENIEINLPAMKSILGAGEYPARLEIVLDNKLYVPMTESITFNPLVEIATQVKPVAPVIKESVKVAKIVVKKSEINEALLRKTQAAMIICKSLHYTPKEEEKNDPEEIIEHAIEQAGELDKDQADTLKQMLDLAESVGLNIDRSTIKEKLIIEEIKPPEPPEDGVSEDEIDDLIKEVPDHELIDAYDDEDFITVDNDNNEVNESEELNEMLSRAERIKARIRMARTETKREVKLHYALRKHSSGAVLNNRARKMAIIAFKRKLAKKPVSELSINEKERLERIIARKKKLIDRIAMKMVPVVRKIEKDRLARQGVTAQ